MMKTITVLEELKKYPVFDLKTFATIAVANKDYAKVYIHRLKKKGLVFNLQRDRYTVHRDPFIVASRVIWPGYISLWSALNFHGLSDQVPNTISVITSRRKRATTIVFMNARIVFEHIDPRYYFGSSKEVMDGFEVFIAEREKAIIDGVLLRRISLSAITGIIKEHIKAVDIEKLVKYIIMTGNKSLAKRVGYVLCSIGFDFFDELEPLIYRTPLLLDYSLPKKGKTDRKWGIIDNMGAVK